MSPKEGLEVSIERSGVPPRLGAEDTCAPSAEGGTARPDADEWLALFQAGDRATMEGCYRDQFAVVEKAIGPMLRGADRETVIHELFSQLLASPELRRAFHGGSFSAWIATVARHRAIDFARRLRREVGMKSAYENAGHDYDSHEWHGAAEAKLLIERFRRDHVPAEWQGIFELRFLQRLSQQAAAGRLAIGRTTLAYREVRLRRLLRRFLFAEESTK